MKQIYLFRLFLIAYLLFTGCSPKETFYFSKSQVSFGHYQKEKQLPNLPDNNDILAESSELNPPIYADPPVTSASNVSAKNPEPQLLLKQTHSSDLNASMLNRKLKMYSSGNEVKSKKLQSKVLKKFLREPAVNKKVNGLALVGFILSLGFIGFLITYSSVVLLLGLIGTILSIFGLVNIHKNPDKYSGKGFAWAGIIIGLLFTLFFVGFLLAFAGAF